MDIHSSRTIHSSIPDAGCGFWNLIRLGSAFSLLFAYACSLPANDSPTPAAERGCIQDFDPAADYFPRKTTVEFAENFSVEYRGFYKVVTVREASPSGAVDVYVLTQCGATAPALTGELQGAQIVSIPVESFFSHSTTHHQPLVDLGRVDVLTGVASAQYAIHDEIAARIGSGRIVDYAPGGIVDAERVIAASPAILMASQNGDPALAVIRNGGVPIVANTEWLERTALGRAEWIKYIALFLNEEAVAEERFAGVRDAYRQWMQRAAGIPANERPRVTTGGIFRGDYTVAGGNSYVAGLIADAGAHYVWADNGQRHGDGQPRSRDRTRRSGRLLDQRRRLEHARRNAGG